MSDLNAMQGTKRVIEHTVNGKTYKLSPLDLNDLAEFENQIREERLDVALKYFKPDGTEVREQARAGIVKEFLSSYGAVSTSAELVTMNGQRFTWWAAMRRNHPGTSLEEAGALLDLTNMYEVVTKIDAMSTPPDEKDAEGKQGENPPMTEKKEVGAQ